MVDLNKPFREMTPEEKRLLLKVLARMESEGRVTISRNESGENIVTLIRK